MTIRILFWNVDTQKDFMLKGGKLYVEGAESILPNLKKLTDFASKYEIKVMNTADWHTKDSKEISDAPDFKTTFPSHCMEFTIGARLVDETTASNSYIVHYNDKEVSPTLLYTHREIVIFKDGFDVFVGNPHTNKIVDILNPELIVVYGVATNVCVDYAVMGLVKRGRKVVVVTDAIKGLPNLPVEPVLDKWKANGVALKITDQIVNELSLVV